MAARIRATAIGRSWQGVGDSLVATRRGGTSGRSGRPAEAVDWRVIRSNSAHGHQTLSSSRASHPARFGSLDGPPRTGRILTRPIPAPRQAVLQIGSSQPAENSHKRFRASPDRRFASESGANCRHRGLAIVPGLIRFTVSLVTGRHFHDFLPRNCQSRAYRTLNGFCGKQS